MGILESSEARCAYLNIIAGGLGFVGAGTNIVVSQLVSQGVQIGSVSVIVFKKKTFWFNLLSHIQIKIFCQKCSINMLFTYHL